MEYIVPSIGRCGSKIMCRLIASATGRKVKPSYSFDDLEQETGHVRHTHIPLYRELPYDYRAVFMIGSIGDSIASMYQERCNLKKHLVAMDVGSNDRGLFGELMQEGSKDAAFAFLIGDDRFGFKRNVESWLDSQNTLFVRYEELCSRSKGDVLARVSEHIGVELGDFDIYPRYSSMSQLPLVLQVMVREEYGDAA